MLTPEERRLKDIRERMEAHLRRRLAGLVKGIDEEMQPGAREFCLGAVEDFSDAYAALKGENALIAAERDESRADADRLAEALRDTRLHGRFTYKAQEALRAHDERKA